MQRTDRPARTRLEPLLDAGAEATAGELAARESGYCSLSAFTFEPPSPGT
ncbi:hypothetical protein [Nocardia sputorum]|nr:hypothetical protein [Nocardia sputorum]